MKSKTLKLRSLWYSFDLSLIVLTVQYYGFSKLATISGLQQYPKICLVIRAHLSFDLLRNSAPQADLDFSIWFKSCTSKQLISLIDAHYNIFPMVVIRCFKYLGTGNAGTFE